jgi:hypothetical protein
MKREVSRDKYLPAFSLDLDDLQLLLSRLLPLFSENDTIYSSIELELRRETLEFKNVEEIREYNGLRGRITNFRFYLSQGEKKISVRSGLILDSRPSVRTSSSNEAWCAGAVETVSSFVQSRRQWYFWFVSWPIVLILVVFGNLPLLAKVVLPKAMHLQGMAYYSWLLLMLALLFLYFAKGSLLPSASIIITREDGFLRRHIGELSLLVAIGSAVLTVIGMVGGK